MEAIAIEAESSLTRDSDGQGVDITILIDYSWEWHCRKHCNLIRTGNASMCILTTILVIFDA